MAGPTGTSQIDDAVERFLAESRYTLQEAQENLVVSTLRQENLPENEGPSVYIPKFGQVTTYALVEGVDMAQAQQITDTVMPITPSEFGAQVVLTDLNLMQARDQFFNVAGRILGDSFARQQDQTLVDDFDNYSLQLGSAGTSLNVGHVMAAHASAKYNTTADGTAGRGGEPAPDPMYFVHTPAALHSLAKTLMGGVGAAAATQVTPDMGRAGFELAAVPGMTIKHNINIQKDASDDAKGAVYSREAQIFVTHGPAASVERERDASLRGWELNFVGRWARGEYDDDWGREMLFDSARPTS